MQALEFDSYIENGVIAIPTQYQEAISHSVRVIVRPKDEKQTGKKTQKKKKLFSLAVDMTGFTFDRNIVNER